MMVTPCPRGKWQNAKEHVTLPPATSKPFLATSGCDLLGGLDSYKFSIEQHIVENFQCASDEEWRVDPGMAGEHKPYEQRADGGARRSCNAGYSRSGRSLFLAHYRHDLRLPGGNIHLADTESYEKNDNSQPEIRHEGYKNKENIGREMRGDHGVYEPPACGEPGGQ